MLWSQTYGGCTGHPGRSALQIRDRRNIAPGYAWADDSTRGKVYSIRVAGIRVEFHKWLGDCSQFAGRQRLHRFDLHSKGKY